ncbi:MAG: DUF1287 domain-containing protein [Acidobacteriota bacterium]
MRHTRSLLLLFLLASPVLADGRCLVEAARKQIGVTLYYDSGYQKIPYPNGDVPTSRGVCTDVVVRAYRQLGVDLQVRVHEDMGVAWRLYPKNWGASRPDSNIDHRRVPNLATFFTRKGQSLAVTRNASDYKPGDVVTWRLPSGVPHIGIVSDRRSRAGVPLVIHNIGGGTQEEDSLFLFTLTGHYRYAPEDLRDCG